MVEEDASGSPVAEGNPDDVPPRQTPPLKTLEKEAESLQAQGFDGKDAAKRYLESTTRITLPWNAYRHPARCTLQTLSGGHKRFDLAGYFFGSDNYVYVEVKNANAANNQTQEFEEFLAIAYSATAKLWQELGDPSYEFFWVTWHPFGTLSEWSKLASGDRVRSALQKHTSLLGGQTVVDAVVDAVVSRTWLLLLHGRQDALMPTPAELKKILMELNRL